MKQKIVLALILSPLLLAVVFLLLPANNVINRTPGHAGNGVSNSAVVSADRLIFLLQYISIDYGDAVENHRIINEFEYNEMLDFAATADGWYSELSGENSDPSTQQKLQRLKSLVESKADWSEVKNSAGELIHRLSQELNVIPFPTKTPDLKVGRNLYRQVCADCHGSSGDGNGPAAAWLHPSPSNFQNDERMNLATPHQFFNAITFGVAGTSMPSHQQALSDQQRWDIAFYLMTLRQGFNPRPPTGDVKFSVNELAGASNTELAAKLKFEAASNIDESNLLSTVDYFRHNPPGISVEEKLTYTKQKLLESFESYKRNDFASALNAITDAYLAGVEPLEAQLKRSDVTVIEMEFSKLRSAIRKQRPFFEAELHYDNLGRQLSEIHSAVEPSAAQRGFVLLQSLTIILREGIEAILLIALMLTYLVSAGYVNLKKYVVSGALAGLAAGALTWFAAQFLLTISIIQQEALEGITSLLAAAVLFFVSFWIIHKVDIRKWKTFIRAKAEKALGTGSGLALSAVAFLAVFREAFETVLFYHVLWLRNSAERTSIVLGFVLGAAALAFVLYLVFKLGVRLPLKPFFISTGILLGLLAFVFAGYGVRELQNIGMLKETLLPWEFRWPFLEIHPTVEGLALQLGILISFILGWFSVLAEKLKKVEKKIHLQPADSEVLKLRLRTTKQSPT
jgi:high-affinity iron transporter